MDATTRSSGILIGLLCGAGAAFGWAAGFVAAKHGIAAGFSPADLAFHRYFWSGLLLIPLMLRTGLRDLGGIGWGRGLVMSVLSGPPQAFLAYSGFVLVPLGHGTTIQPACAALFGIILATALLRERMTPQRIFGAAAIIAGLMVFGAESVTTIGAHGVGGDLLFVTAGCFWATAGILLRHWTMPGTRAVAAVGTISVVVMAPPFLLLEGYRHMLQLGAWENALQILVQGLLAGVLPIYLFSHAIMLLGGGRASTFPALVPIFALVVGYLTLGVVPSLPQLVGLVIVLVGFRFTLR
ncbi:MAG TPA: DMT family transporter [Pseudolabrys sp.]|nr:DMT family transporter [Pseudolabrys sp.]